MSEPFADSSTSFDGLGVCASGEQLLPAQFQMCAADEQQYRAIEQNRKAATCNGLIPKLVLEESVDDLMIARVAKECVRNGELKTSTKILIAGDDEDAIEQALMDMTPAERQLYKMGADLHDDLFVAMSGRIFLSSEEQEQYSTYAEIHDAMEKVGQFWEVARWEDLALSEPHSIPECAAVPAAVPAETLPAEPEIAAEEAASEPAQWRAGRLNARVNANGTATHTIVRGDTLWAICRDILKEENRNTESYRPSAREIMNLVREVSAMNGSVPQTMIPGQQITIAKEHVIAAKAARDEAVVIRDDQDRVSQIYHPSGARTEVGMHRDGSVATLKSDGRLWVDNNDGTWEVQSVDENGTAAGRRVKGAVEVGRDGTVTLTNETDGTTTVQYPDGIILQTGDAELEMRQR